jgi:hypothetical protein
MPSTRLLTYSFHPGIQDSATGQSVKVTRAVDVSDVCFYHEPGCLLLYGTVERGPLVQLILPYKKDDPTLGVSTHYFLNELEQELQTSDTVFPIFAKDLGLIPEALVKLLRDYAP